MKESSAVTDKPARRESMPKIAPIRRASFHFTTSISPNFKSLMHSVAWYVYIWLYSLKSGVC